MHKFKDIINNGSKVVHDKELIKDYLQIESCKDVLRLEFEFETYNIMNVEIYVFKKVNMVKKHVVDTRWL